MGTTDKTYTAWGIDDGVHEARGLKPMLTPEEQVALLKTKGVTFERCDEAEAIFALTERDSFLHIASYRKLFPKHQDGCDAGKYIGLDFADLVDLDELDGEIRRAFLLLTNDIERIAKAQLLGRLSSQEQEDGYSIVARFMESQDVGYRKAIKRDLERRRDSNGSGDTYSGALIDRYGESMPVWVFLEVEPFGTQLAFMLFCARLWEDTALRDRHYELTYVKAVRNCCSHLSCIANGFTDAHRSVYDTPFSVQRWLADKGIKSTKARKSKLRNRRMQQLVTTLAAFGTIGGCKSSESLTALSNLSDELKERVKRYGEQNSFVSYLSFLARVVDTVK